ncbi:alpha-ketoglutarate-dependent dioxygenase alkB homolog 7, mitochondrial-like [Ptychodera flava]|uniref:alpha-ketoglutarate-dependent dioxygenase alkB homolog 7, mitochondrial-like n=1 Tax=Ptychodera flava TaxID=63121 RepID=UPI003969DC3B
MALSFLGRRCCQTLTVRFKAAIGNSVRVLLSTESGKLSEQETSDGQQVERETQNYAAPVDEFYYFHEGCTEEVKRTVIDGYKLYLNFLTEDDEQSLQREIDRYMKRMRYEYDHWDDAIHGYRETEFSRWSERNQKIIKRVRDLAFPSDMRQLPLVHVIDLAKDGYIKPHIDSVRFCGNTITGLSLLSSSIMRLVHDKHKEIKVDVLLHPRSLYIMRDAVRLDYTHEILQDSESHFKGQAVPRDRRLSIMCRTEPTDSQS